MAAPQYSAADYLSALQALMPPGKVWPRDPGAVQTKVLAGLAVSYESQTQRSAHLLADAFPATAVELLQEWEATLALPSPAAGPNPSVGARQLLVVARLVGVDGPSIADLERYAALLGFDVTITPLAPFRCGQSRCGQSLGTVDQMYGLLVTVANAANSPFGAYGQAVLRDELGRVVPPFAVLVFEFT